MDLCLCGKILRRVDWRHHALDGEERRQIGSVRGDQDKREEPPDAAHDAAWDGSASGERTVISPTDVVYIGVFAAPSAVS